MQQNQLSIFKRKQFAKVFIQAIDAVAPTGESSVMKTLPSYLAYLHRVGYLESTIEKYFADVKKFSVFMRSKKAGEITQHDIEQWIETLVSKKGEGLDRKTVNRKVSAIINYFSWLEGLHVVTTSPAAGIGNQRVVSPLPEYLYEQEIKVLYQEASKDPRLYLIVLLLLETGMKSSELFNLKTADVDTSDPYSPELWIKHKGKGIKKDRKVSLPQHFLPVYRQYIKDYAITDTLFPFTERAVQYLFTDLKTKTKIDKKLSPKILRHTHVVRAYKRGEESERIFERIGLAPDSRVEADEVYRKLAARGI